MEQNCESNLILVQQISESLSIFLGLLLFHDSSTLRVVYDLDFGFILALLYPTKKLMDFQFKRIQEINHLYLYLVIYLEIRLCSISQHIVEQMYKEF